MSPLWLVWLWAVGAPVAAVIAWRAEGHKWMEVDDAAFVDWLTGVYWSALAGLFWPPILVLWVLYRVLRPSVRR